MHDLEDARELPPDLAKIAAQADAQLAGDEAAPGQAEAAEQLEPAGAEFAAMLTMAVAVATPALPFLPACYPPEVCTQIGIAFAAVAKKHGWDLEALQAPELALAAAALPPTIMAVVAARRHFAELRDRQQPIEGAVTEKPAA